ncbi:HNH endonuclease signature motif containing protein [Arthrobacter alpinus]|uniref:HNH endonuclease signature motif containing protein n=1 Tax=Arthrobacter alpinus TaxID=656366 RepID=UPI000AAD5258|nr:HNH endonuclease signature motif containing protein [Arthrobacter alpinus]
MSSRECFPEDRGDPATQDVAGLLAGITVPSIEPFGPDNPALAGLSGRVPFPVPVLEPLTRLVVARGVYDAGIAALSAMKGLEDALAACKASLMDRIMGAASVEAAAMELDPWQAGMAETSAVSNMALVLRIPEVTASALVHHSIDLLRHRPGTFRALESGVLSWRHACIVMNEITTLHETPGITEEDVAGFEARLLVLAVGTTAAGFASKARRARESLFPASMSIRTKKAFAQRRMSCESGRDGMSWMTFYLPTVAAESILARCTRSARAIKGDARRQHRAANHARRNEAGQCTTGVVGTREDLLEHRTLGQLCVDVAAQLLMGQDLPANTYTNPTSTDHETSSADTFNPSNGTAGGRVFRSGSHDGAGQGSSGQDAGGVSFGGVTLIDEVPGWAHKDPEQPAGWKPVPGGGCDANNTPGGANVASPAADPPAPPDEPSGHWPGEPVAKPLRGQPPDEPCYQPDVDELLIGEVVGDESGFVDGVIDGIVEDPGQDYLDQLKELRDGGVMAGPPLPEAIVLVTVPFLGLLDLTDERGELVGRGGGPIPADIARKLLAGSSTFLRVLTDPVTGEMLPLSPERYTLREAEREVLRAMAGSCYYPNCPNPIMDTEFDHLMPFERGGKTTLENVHPACKKHHGLKHFKDDKDKHGVYRRFREPQRQWIRIRGWTPKMTPDGRVGWITPTGAYEPPPAEQAQPTKYPRWLKKRITWQRITRLHKDQEHEEG